MSDVVGVVNNLKDYFNVKAFLSSLRESSMISSAVPVLASSVVCFLMRAKIAFTCLTGSYFDRVNSASQSQERQRQGYSNSMVFKYLVASTAIPEVIMGEVLNLGGMLAIHYFQNVPSHTGAILLVFHTLFHVGLGVAFILRPRDTLKDILAMQSVLPEIPKSKSQENAKTKANSNSNSQTQTSAKSNASSRGSGGKGNNRQRKGKRNGASNSRQEQEQGQGQQGQGQQELRTQSQEFENKPASSFLHRLYQAIGRSTLFVDSALYAFNCVFIGTFMDSKVAMTVLCLGVFAYRRIEKVLLKAGAQHLIKLNTPLSSPPPPPPPSSSSVGPSDLNASKNVSQSSGSEDLKATSAVEQDQAKERQARPSNSKIYKGDYYYAHKTSTKEYIVTDGLPQPVKKSN